LFCSWLLNSFHAKARRREGAKQRRAGGAALMHKRHRTEGAGVTEGSARDAGVRARRRTNIMGTALPTRSSQSPLLFLCALRALCAMPFFWKAQTPPALRCFAPSRLRVKRVEKTQTST